MNHRSYSLGAKLRAFTLVEILIVVVILGILAAFVIPLFANATRDSEKASFAESLRTFYHAAILYETQENTILPDGSSGTIPPGMEGYIRGEQWTRPTPIGGVWDTEANSFGITSAIGVHFNGQGASQDDAFMTTIDQFIDDGILASGAFRKLDADRFYMVVQE